MESVYTKLVAFSTCTVTTIEASIKAKWEDIRLYLDVNRVRQNLRFA